MVATSTTTTTTTAATATVKKMSSMNLGDLKTNELGISQATFDGLGSKMNETTASTTVASVLKTVVSAVPHAAFEHLKDLAVR